MINLLIIIVTFLVVMPLALLFILAVKLLDFITLGYFDLSEKASNLCSRASDKCNELKHKYK